MKCFNMEILSLKDFQVIYFNNYNFNILLLQIIMYMTSYNIMWYSIKNVNIDSITGKINLIIPFSLKKIFTVKT